MLPQISLDQWQALIHVVDAGGYAQAAQKLHKSQSALTYSIQKIETQLGIKAFELQGRKAILTPTGHMLYRRALALVNEATDLEKAAHRLAAGWEAEIQLAAEILFPIATLLDCLNQLAQESPRTRVELLESVLGGTAEALLQGRVDLAISPQQPPGFLGELLMRVRLIAVAHADHPLHRMGTTLSQRDLNQFRHIVVRDSGTQRDRRTGTVEVEQRWTVGQIATSIHAVSHGYGFAWLPEAQIQNELDKGVLKPLSLREGSIREVPLYLILPNAELAGPGVQRLAELIRQSVADANRS